MGPETVELSPYCIENVPDCSALVKESEDEYLDFLLQVELVQSEEGTHKSDEPAAIRL